MRTQPTSLAALQPRPASPRRRTVSRRLTFAAVLAALVVSTSAEGGTITIRTDSYGGTPWVTGINMGHFADGTNAPDIWRYFGAAGARVFVNPGIVEASDDIAGWGDGVTDRDSFFARRAAMDANALNTAYINWPYLENRYATANTAYTDGPGNMMKIASAFGELHAQGTSILVNLTAGESAFPLASADDWAGKWELWQHYYFQAFYLAREFDVARFSMFNEPNHPNANGLTPANWQMRLELASDAIQRAVAEVNARYAKTLVPAVFAPNTAGATGTAWSDWGAYAINYRHRKVNGFSYSDWNNLHYYNYQSYGGPTHTDGSSFGSTLATMRANVADAMPSESPYPIAITEFNSLTAANFDATIESLDTPRRYAQLGSILVNLVKAYIREMYVFKLAQTNRDDVGANYPVQKNGLAYTDNATASPSAYRYGGLTHGGEVCRLFFKAADPGRSRPGFDRGSGLDNLDIMVTRDNSTGRHWVFLVNHDTVAKTIELDTAALGNLQDNRVIIEEVSSSIYGAVAKYTRVNNNVIACGSMPARSVWLVTLPTAPQLITQSSGTPTLNVFASDDAMVKDGSNKDVNYGASANLYAKNDVSSANGRNATFVKFTVPAAVDLAKVELAVLNLQGSTLTTSGVAQAFVYGCTTDNWQESTLTWTSAPGLAQDHSVGNRIRDAVATGQGSTLRLLGQITVEGTAISERQIDVTDFIKSQADRIVTFMVVQDPRRDITLDPNRPLGNYAVGDTQADGLKFVSKEGAAAASVDGPVLKIVRRQ